MDEATILRNADRLEADVITLDAARVVLYNRGSVALANQLGKRAIEWKTQADEMRKRAKSMTRPTGKGW